MGDMEDVKPRKIVFVTVGTTCFDALVRAMDNQVVKQELLKRGYTHLLIQMGRGSYIPTKVYLHFRDSLYVYRSVLGNVISWFCFNRYFCIHMVEDWIFRPVALNLNGIVFSLWAKQQQFWICSLYGVRKVEGRRIILKICRNNLATFLIIFRGL